MRITGDPIVSNANDKLIGDRAIRHIEQEVMYGEERVTRIHTVWELPQGAVMVYEYTSCNYPSSTVCFFDSLEEYLDAVESVDWISTAPLQQHRT